MLAELNKHILNKPELWSNPVSHWISIHGADIERSPGDSRLLGSRSQRIIGGANVNKTPMKILTRSPTLPTPEADSFFGFCSSTQKTLQDQHGPPATPPPRVPAAPPRPVEPPTSPRPSPLRRPAEPPASPRPVKRARGAAVSPPEEHSEAEPSDPSDRSDPSDPSMEALTKGLKLSWWLGGKWVASLFCI